jgi:hypothetical protein
VLQPTAAALNNYRAQLKQIMQWNAAGKTLKHVVSMPHSVRVCQ